MVPDAAPPVLGRVACPLTFSLPGTAPRNFSPSSTTVGSRPTWGRRAWDVPMPPPPEQLSPRSQRTAHSLELTVVLADLATACNGADGIAAPTFPVRSLRVGGRRHLPQGPQAPEPAARGLSLLAPAPQPLPLPGARPPRPCPVPPHPPLSCSQRRTPSADAGAGNCARPCQGRPCAWAAGGADRSAFSPACQGCVPARTRRPGPARSPACHRGRQRPARAGPPAPTAPTTKPLGAPCAPRAPRRALERAARWWGYVLTRPLLTAESPRPKASGPPAGRSPHRTSPKSTSDAACAPPPVPPSLPPAVEGTLACWRGRRQTGGRLCSTHS